jgi:hypothetical protein
LAQQSQREADELAEKAFLDKKIMGAPLARPLFFAKI